MKHEKQFKNTLRTAGERVTTPRLGIFRILARSSPISMPNLTTKAAESGIDPVTAYRTIHLFRRLALVQEMGLGRNRLFELSDTYHSHHHHFTCVRCGKITDFDSEAIEASLVQAGQDLGFTMGSHQLEVTGICKTCR